MSEQFSRTEMLIGSENLAKLANSHVAVFGVGGVGGYAIEALVRSGIGKIDIIDNDKVSISNLNRQIIALHSTIGKYKVNVATPETSDQFDFTKYDYIVDAIDTVSGKIELIIQANQAQTPIISSMGAGNKMNPADFEVSDIYKTSVCPLAKVMRQELKKRGIKKLKVVYSKEPPIKQEGRRIPASNAFVPSTVGLIIASEVIKDLIE